jgi:hypothetical protein
MATDVDLVGEGQEKVTSDVDLAGESAEEVVTSVDLVVVGLEVLAGEGEDKVNNEGGVEERRAE